MITRQNFDRSTVAYDKTLPPPLAFIPRNPRCAHKPRGMYRAGAQSLILSPPNGMMDPSDPSTFQRVYRFTGPPPVMTERMRRFT